MKKMIKRHYAIHDLKAGYFFNSLVFQNDADAIRWFTTQVNGDKKENLISRNPGDFMLFYMFDIDDKTGMVGKWNPAENKLEKQEAPKELIMGNSCVEDENKQFSINELVGMLKMELEKDNVHDISEAL
jgi:hypothetical protein